MTTYAQLNTDNTISRMILHTGNIEWDSTHFCPAGALTPDEATLFHVVPFETSDPPECDQYHRAVELAPAVIDGRVVQIWDIVAIPTEELAATAARIEAARIAALWQAAHDYEYAEISGSAVGLLAMGVMQELPKCIAVQNWIKSIWTLYYTRKAGTSAETDYSSCGACPYSVPELMTELGV